MGQADYYKHGDWNAICDRCGFKYKASDLRKEYTGLRVCRFCWDPRHPQEKLRVRADDPSVPWVRPEPDDTEIEVLGPELIPDPFFNNSGAWVATDSFSVQGGEAVADGAERTPIIGIGPIGVDAGSTYRVIVEISAVNSGSVGFKVGGVERTGYSSPQTIQLDLVAGEELVGSEDNFTFIESEPAGNLGDIGVTRGIYLRPNGEQLFVHGTTPGQVYRYPLSVPWMVASVGAADGTFSIGTRYGLYMSSDGTKIYLIRRFNSTVEQYVLSTPWDVTTASLDDTFDYSATTGSNGPNGLFISKGGNRLYLCTSSSDAVYQFDLSTPWEIGTAIDSGNELSLSHNAHDVFLSDDGVSAYVLAAQTGPSGEAVVHRYSLSTPWDISTGTLQISPLLNQSTVGGFHFRSNFRAMFLAEYAPGDDDFARQYDDTLATMLIGDEFDGAITKFSVRQVFT